MENLSAGMLRMMRLVVLMVTLATASGSVFAEFVGVSRGEFKDHYRQQKQMMWCWASSVEMVLSYQGVKLPQDKIVEYVKGMVVNAPGSAYEMAAVTNGLMLDESGKRVVVSGQFVLGAPNPTVLYNQLKQKRPLILTYQPLRFGQPGHAVVLTGADVTIKDKVGVIVNKVHIFDPFPYRVELGTNALIKDDSRTYNEYEPQTTPYGIALPTGIITGVILIDGTHP